MDEERKNEIRAILDALGDPELKVKPKRKTLSLKKKPVKGLMNMEAYNGKV